MMTGVNAEKLEALIKKNDLYLETYENNSKRLISSINDLNGCYSGSSLNYLFSEPVNKIKDIQTITNTIRNYSTILNNVKLSYQKQDETFKTQVSHISSKLQ